MNFLLDNFARTQNLTTYSKYFKKLTKVVR